MVTFSFKIEPKGYYDFLCGRVKVLETNLISENLYRELVKKNFDEFVEFLQNYPYKDFIADRSFNSVKNGIQRRKEKEFEEFEKFGLGDFINVFFNSSKYFLLLKKIVLGDISEYSEDEFVNSLLKGDELLPEEIRGCFEELKKDYPTYIKPLVVDVHYLNFLLRSSKKTQSPFIVDFYESFVKNTILATLMRHYNFVKNNFITQENFNEVLSYIESHLDLKDFLSKFGNYSDFEKFLDESKSLYSEEHLEESYKILTYNTLKEAFAKGKYLNEGIEPIFVYLLRLNFETSLLEKLAYALYYGVNPKEIPELEFAYE